MMSKGLGIGWLAKANGLACLNEEVDLQSFALPLSTRPPRSRRKCWTTSQSYKRQQFGNLVEDEIFGLETNDRFSPVVQSFANSPNGCGHCKRNSA